MYKDPDTGEEQEIVIENTESRSQMEIAKMRFAYYDRNCMK